MRTVLIRVEGAKRPIRKMQFETGMRVSDILRYLKVPEGYDLALASDPTSPFPREAEVQSLIADGEHLVVRSNSAAVENATPFTLSLSN